jgi:hypothetical protein
MTVHPGVLVRHPAGPRSWFAASIPATVGFIAVALLVGSASGRASVGIVVGITLVAASGFVARRRSLDCLTAYAVGTAATVLGLYGALAIATELWLHGIGI